MANQPCIDMRKDDQGGFIHHPKTTRFYDQDQPTKVLLETRCEECALILDTQIVDKSSVPAEED